MGDRFKTISLLDDDGSMLIKDTCTDRVFWGFPLYDFGKKRYTGEIELGNGIILTTPSVMEENQHLVEKRRIAEAKKDSRYHIIDTESLQRVTVYDTQTGAILSGTWIREGRNFTNKLELETNEITEDTMFK